MSVPRFTDRNVRATHVFMKLLTVVVNNDNAQARDDLDLILTEIIGHAIAASVVEDAQALAGGHADFDVHQAASITRISDRDDSRDAVRMSLMLASHTNTRIQRNRLISNCRRRDADGRRSDHLGRRDVRNGICPG